MDDLIVDFSYVDLRRTFLPFGRRYGSLLLDDTEHEQNDEVAPDLEFPPNWATIFGMFIATTMKHEPGLSQLFKLVGGALILIEGVLWGGFRLCEEEAGTRRWNLP